MHGFFKNFSKIHRRCFKKNVSLDVVFKEFFKYLQILFLNNFSKVHWPGCLKNSRRGFLKDFSKVSRCGFLKNFLIVSRQGFSKKFQRSPVLGFQVFFKGLQSCFFFQVFFNGLQACFFWRIFQMSLGLCFIEFFKGFQASLFKWGFKGFFKGIQADF